MLLIHQRLAELWSMQKHKPLNEEQELEMIHCLDANMNYAYKLAHLYNLSGLASLIDDMEWLHDICADIDRLEIQYKNENPASR